MEDAHLVAFRPHDDDMSLNYVQMTAECPVLPWDETWQFLQDVRGDVICAGAGGCGREFVAAQLFCWRIMLGDASIEDISMRRLFSEQPELRALRRALFRPDKSFVYREDLDLSDFSLMSTLVVPYRWRVRKRCKSWDLLVPAIATVARFCSEWGILAVRHTGGPVPLSVEQLQRLGIIRIAGSPYGVRDLTDSNIYAAEFQ